MPPDELLPPDEFVILEAAVTCPKTLCAAESLGSWIASDEPGESPDASLQLCPECGHHWDAEYPGYSFTVEA